MCRPFHYQPFERVLEQDHARMLANEKELVIGLTTFFAPALKVY